MNITLSIIQFCLYTFHIPLVEEDQYVAHEIKEYTFDYRETIYRLIHKSEYKSIDFGNKTYDIFLDKENKNFYYIIYTNK